jgi:hypothetical protein
LNYCLLGGALAMIRDAWTITIGKSPGQEIIVVKVPKGSARNRGIAQRVINALRAKISIEKLTLEVVVMDGEPMEQPALFGRTSEAEEFVRSMMPKLATYRWLPAKLDW